MPEHDESRALDQDPAPEQHSNDDESTTALRQPVGHTTAGHGNQLPLFATPDSPAGPNGIGAHSDLDCHDWHVIAMDALLQLAQSGREFTSDNVHDLIPAWLEPCHPNEVGRLFTIAAERRLIAPTGRFTRSRRLPRHAGAIRVWRGIQQELAA